MSKALKPKEMAEKLGVTVLTLQRWDNKGVLLYNIFDWWECDELLESLYYPNAGELTL